MAHNHLVLTTIHPCMVLHPTENRWSISQLKCP